jgi:hypothetical protein
MQSVEGYGRGPAGSSPGGKNKAGAAGGFVGGCGRHPGESSGARPSHGVTADYPDGGTREETGDAKMFENFEAMAKAQRG